VRAVPPEMPRLSGLSPERLREETLRRARAAPVPEHADAIVERALGYPFDPPAHSYALVGRNDVRFSAVDPEDLAGSTVVHRDEEIGLEQACRQLGVSTTALMTPRHIVLAYGSNGSPRALLRKYARTEADQAQLVLPVLRGELAGFDITYSAHLSAYGSLPATLHPAPEVTATAFLTLLTDDQLVRMAETEFRYSLQRLGGVSFDSDHHPCSECLVFVSRYGSFALDGATVSLAAVEAAGRRNAQVLPEPEALDSARRSLGVEEELEEFIVNNVRDPDRSQRFTDVLEQRSIPFQHAHAAVIDI
jgi:hypothetical protein